MKSLPFFIFCIIFLISNSNAINLNQNVVLNISESNSSMTFGTPIVLDRLLMEYNSINMDNVSYTDNTGEGTFNISTPINWSSDNLNINSNAFPYLSFTNLTEKHISNT